MSLIITPTSATTLTVAQQQALDAIAIKNICTQLFNTNVSAFTKLFNMVWNNPHGLTPTQVCSALGTDAGELFILASSLQTVLNTAQPGILTQSIPAGTTVAVNSNGSVTITTTPTT